ncbi:MAG: glutamine amidotransferase-related protein [Nitrososphaeria archaeon]
MRKALVINNGSNYLHELVTKIRELGVFNEIKIADPGSELEEADVYFVSGRSSRSLVTMKNFINLLKELEGRPALYICFGAEALNLYLGGTLRRANGFLYGAFQVRFEGSRYVSDGVKTFHVSRHFNIGSLNPRSRPVAWSSNGVEAYEHKDSFAVMFHPEVSNKDGTELLAAFVRKSL